MLRNESLRVEIDKTTGGIRGVCAASEETARVGQQLAMTGLTGPDGAPASSRMICETIEVDSAGPALIQVFARGTLVDPRGDRTLAAFRQRYRLWTGRPILELEIMLSDLDPAWLERAASADPWVHFLSCRWAWPDPDSMLRRTCLLAPDLTEADRPETPDAFDISTRKHRTALLFGGLAHHRRHGARMLDTLLIAGRESARSFRLGVVLDQEYPCHAAFDLITPAAVAPTEAGPPATGTSGWLFQLDNKAVAVTRVEHVDPSGNGRGWGIAFHLLETSGRPVRCRLRTFRNPVWARQTDFNHERVVELPIDADAVLIDLTPHEMARIDISLG
jgi:alpha-mannosidase